MKPQSPQYVDREILTLNREGEWLADGHPITHEPTRNLFYRSLSRREDGSWWLVIGRESKRVEVEDTAYFVRRLEGTPESGFEVCLSDGTREPLLAHTLFMTAGRLTCLTQAGHEARFLRAPYTDLLLQSLGEQNGVYELKIQGKSIELGRPLPSTILFFDGICGLCNRVVDFLMQRDSRGLLHYAPLQGRTAAALLPMKQRLHLDTVVLLHDSSTLERSSAVLRCLSIMGGPWSFAGILILVPVLIRDFAYNFIASNRYSWFGRRETCRLPTPSERDRILP